MSHIKFINREIEIDCSDSKPKANFVPFVSAAGVKKEMKDGYKHIASRTLKYAQARLEVGPFTFTANPECLGAWKRQDTKTEYSLPQLEHAIRHHLGSMKAREIMREINWIRDPKPTATKETPINPFNGVRHTAKQALASGRGMLFRNDDREFFMSDKPITNSKILSKLAKAGWWVSKVKGS